MLDRGRGDRRPVGGPGYRERDSVGLASWIKGSQSLQQAEWCARKTNCLFTPVYTKNHELRSSHRDQYALYAFY